MDAMNYQQGKGHSCHGQHPPAGINLCNVTNNTISISNSTCTLGFNPGQSQASPDGDGEDDAADAVTAKKAADNPPKQKKPPPRTPPGNGVGPKQKKPPPGTPPENGVDGLPLIGYHVIPEHERQITMEHARNNYPSRWVFRKNRHEHDKPWEHQGFPDEENLQEFMAELKQVRSETQKEATRAGKRHVINNFAINR